MTVHMFPGTGFDSNVFLITGGNPILVDTGTGKNADKLLNKISKVTELDRIRTIVLTHRHYDHVGGAAALSKRLSAKVLIHELDAPPVRDGDPWGTEAGLFGGPMEPVPVETLKGGELLSSGASTFLVIHTPGHSAGGISLFDSSEGSLISGDTVFVGGVGRWDLTTGNHRELVQSVRKLQRLGPKNLYPGHGPSAKGDAAEQIAEALRQLGEC
jgi:hydroxyacylglutathione hydrolase